MKTTMIAAVLALGSTANADAPKPAPEIADMAKGMAGTWRCTGKYLADEKGTWIETKGTNKMSVASDLDKFWIKGEWSSEGTNKAKMKGVEYLTYDAAQKKWYRIAVDNTGGHEVASSPDGKAWTGEMRMNGVTMKTRATVALEARKLEVTADAELGKKFVPVFEMTCRK